MKAKLIVNNKEIEVEISEEEFDKLKNSAQIKTGYERLYDEDYYVDNSYGNVEKIFDGEFDYGYEYYSAANYYSDYTVAENNTRADKLMRQLRRFAVEHRKEKINWGDREEKYSIFYSYSLEKLLYTNSCVCRNYGTIFFDSIENVQLAIKTFHDELVWYFTEYKDSL